MLGHRIRLIEAQDYMETGFEQKAVELENATHVRETYIS
jgi:hypothetical protein